MYFCKRDQVAIFKPMSRFIEGRNQAFGVNASNYAVDRILSGWIYYGEVFPKIRVDRAKKPKDVCNNNKNAVVVTVISYGDLIFQRGSSQDDNLVLAKLAQVFRQTLAGMLRHGSICIKLCNSWDRSRGPWLANVVWV